jgi:hypothetical protein
MGYRRIHTRTALRQALGAAGALGLGLLAGHAAADEPRKVTEPHVLAEPTEITQVADAFDDFDVFDLHISLGYQYTSKSAKIFRESFIAQPGLAMGGYTSNSMNVAEYAETTHRLNTRAEIGIFKDIALVFRVPIILKNERELKGLDGSEAQQSAILQGAPGEQLFQLPFKSPPRSGVEYLAVGLDLGIMNQARDFTKPTWVFGLEGRFDVSEPMHACNENTGGLNQAGPQVKCAHPSDVNRNGIPGELFTDISGPANLEGNQSGEREPGVSRGVTGLEVHTYLSKRIKYIEPYGGVKALFEFQNDSSDYGQTDLKGSLVNHPPLVGTMILGMAVIPWEIRDAFQRVTLDFRFEGSYYTEGRDYSELFDALGSSDARSLRRPNFAEYRGNVDPATGTLDATNPSVVNTASGKVYFTGLTDVQQHGEYKFSTQFTWQAGEYVKFNLGGGYTLVQGHNITFDQACNPDFSNDLGKSGPCRNTLRNGGFDPTGIPNPNFRHVTNVPGRRFRVDDSHAFDVWLNATVMF